MTLLYTISIVSWMSSLLPLGMCWRHWKTGRLTQLIGLLVGLSFLCDLAMFTLGMARFNTYPVGNAFMLVQSLILLFIYRDALKANASLFLLIGIVFTAFSVVNFFFIQGPFVVNSHSMVASSVGFIILSLVYFRKLLVNLPETFVHRIPMVWVNTAVLIYFSGNLFLFMLYNYFFSTLWILHNVLNVIKNILLFIAVWQSQRTTTSSSS